jgi:hypothetical protein
MRKKEVLFRSLGEHLAGVAQEATEEVLLAAPYIKKGALKRILSSVSDDCSVRIVTCWNLQEIAVGASDLEIWELLRRRRQCSLELCPSMHAKYYRFDDICIVGSANLTGAGLGLREKSNLELLAHFSPSATKEFEEEIDDRISTSVTESMYLQYRKLLDQYEDAHPEIVQNDDAYSVPAEDVGSEVRDSGDEFGDARPDSSEWWIPTLRHPEDLYRVYAGVPEDLTTATWEHGSWDLRHFDLPEGLEKRTFEMEVRWQLLQKPVVQKIDSFVETSKRFGAVRDHLRTLPCAQNEGFDPTGAWQTLMRWLLHFFDDRYRRYEANYSEIFVREE